MKKIIVSLIVIFGLASSVNAQSMKGDLLKMVSRCYERWRVESDVDENGRPIEFGAIQYDIANGYVETSGSWPTCGCGCQAQAAAFKDVDGNYTYLAFEMFDCDDYGKSMSTRPVQEVMPDGFGLESFLGHKVDKPDEFSFQLVFEIPRRGTDMKVHLGVLPLGLVPNDVNGLTYCSSTEIRNSSLLGTMREIAENIGNISLLLLTQGNYGDLPSEHQQKIDKSISAYNKISVYDKKSMSDICECAIQLKKLYDIYISLECLDMTLKWNKQTAKFEIKSKGAKVTPCSFADFLTKVVAYADFGC